MVPYHRVSTGRQLGGGRGPAGSLVSVREAYVRSDQNHSVCWHWEEIGLEEGGGFGIEKWACAHPPKCNNKNDNDDDEGHQPGWHTERHVEVRGSGVE